MAGERILDGLNDEQRRAVTHDAGPLLIIAGAGTGKTTVITRRIAWLIAQRKARPEEILALTFTDKAAAEMEERVDTLAPYGYADVEIATFHAFGDRLLREHALEVGLQPDFRILNRAEQIIFFRDRLFEFPLVRYRPLGDPTRHIRAIITLISRCKDEDIAPEEYQAYVERLQAQAAAAPGDAELRDRAAQHLELAQTYAKYQALTAVAGVVDFGDQIVHALRRLDGPEPQALHYETATQEADAVAQMIRERVEQGAWTYDDVAILVRSNNDADQFLRSLNLRGVPWTFSGNAGLYGRPEIRLLIAFLRSVAHPDDSVSVHYLASSDIYQVPIIDLTRCATSADRRHRWLFDVLRNVETLPETRDEVGDEGRAAIRRLVADLTRYMELAREMPTGELLYQLLIDSGWLARMSKAATARVEAEVQNISKFFRRVQDASKALRYDNVREFVNHLDALIDAGEDPAVAEADVETAAVRVLTVHKAKGLEFPVVFLVTLAQDKFPLRRRKAALELPMELIKESLPPSADFHQQEERRLFY